jgi:hypothetical protein
MSNKNNVVLRKKDLGNGDVSGDIKKSLTGQNFMKTKKETEKNVFINDLGKTKANQNSLNKQLKTNQYGNTSNDINTIQKLPKKIEDFDENDELVKLLLKNPEEMSIEEKVYIKSLSKEEFDRFVNFLKIKDRELKWRGNDYGSGRYNETLINIYRDASDPFDIKYLRMKKFLKMNYNTYLASKHSESFKQEMTNYRTKVKSSSTANKFIEEDLGEGDELNATASTNFEETAKSIFKELDMFKDTLMSHKNNIEIKKIELQNRIVDQDLDYKSKVVRKDLQKMVDLKAKPKSELDLLIEQYRANLDGYKKQLDKHVVSSIVKIKDYCSRMNLTTREAIKLLDKNSLLSEEVGLNEMNKQLIKLKILEQSEANYLIEVIKRYHDDPISVDALEMIIDENLEKGYKDEELENAIIEEEDNDNYDY